MNAFIRRQTGTNIRDVGCSMRGLDPALVHDLAAEGEARRLLTPVLLRRARRIAQVPVRHKPRTDRGGHSFLSLLGIASDYFMHTVRRPFLITGLVSGAVAAIGVLMLALGPRLPGLVLASAGGLGGLLSLVGEYVHRIYELGQGIPFYKLRDLDADDGVASDAVESPPARAQPSSRALPGGRF
jgi:hypothetical protein